MDEVRVIQTRIGRYRPSDELATETPHARADFRSIDSGVARAGRQRQRFWNELEVDRCIGGLLFVTARDIVKESVTQRPDVRVVGRHRCRYKHSAPREERDRGTVRLKR